MIRESGKCSSVSIERSCRYVSSSTTRFFNKFTHFLSPQMTFVLFRSSPHLKFEPFRPWGCQLASLPQPRPGGKNTIFTNDGDKGGSKFGDKHCPGQGTARFAPGILACVHIVWWSVRCHPLITKSGLMRKKKLS